MSTEIESLPRARFDELALFVEVAAAGSLAAAAKRLGLPKSTVGRAVARIEQDLGVPLIRRMVRGPGLTEQGKQLALLAAPHVNALRDLSAAVGRDASEAYGTLRVTAAPDVAMLVLAPLLPLFSARHPRVHVEVDLSMEIKDLVREGFDLAIRFSQQRTLPSSALVAKRLARLDMGLYASASYLAQREAPRRVEDLSRHEFVLLHGREGKDTLRLEGPRGSLKQTVHGRINANDMLFLREAVTAGVGLAALPWFVASAAVADGRLVRVLRDYHVQGVTAYAVHAPTSAPSPKLRAFRDLLVEHAPRLFANP